MPIDRGYPADDEPLPPEDVDSAPVSPDAAESTADPNDDIPVPIAMSPAEVDERAQVVEQLRDDSAASIDREAEPPPVGA
jgi:hypothetical protein